MDRCSRWRFVAIGLLCSAIYLGGVAYGRSGIDMVRASVVLNAHASSHRHLGGAATEGTSSADHGEIAEHHKSPAFDPIVFLLITFTASVLSQQVVNIVPHAFR